MVADELPEEVEVPDGLDGYDDDLVNRHVTRYGRYVLKIIGPRSPFSFALFDILIIVDETGTGD